MDKKVITIKWLILLSSSVIITLLFVNRIGKPIESFETMIYQKLSGKPPEHFQLDSLGVPMVVYEGKLGKQYNAVSVAEQAIKWSTKEDTISKRIFFNCIGWLTNNFTVLNDSSIIYLDKYDWQSFKMISPWRSAMNQGRAIQAFIHAYEKTKDTIFIKYARESMNALFTEVKNGGVTYIDSIGYWFEEYADDNVPESRVLNGMIVVLQALNDFYKITNDTNAYILFNKGVASVKHTLYLYDNNGHSNYDVLGKPASSWYHKFHIEQLGFLYNETHDPIFKEFQQKWMLYKEPSYIAGLIRKPTNIGLFAVFSIFVGVFTMLFIVDYLLWFWKRKVKVLKDLKI